jgi:hypothetical protein
MSNDGRNASTPPQKKCGDPSRRDLTLMPFGPHIVESFKIRRPEVVLGRHSGQNGLV